MPSADATSTPRHPTDPPRAEFRHSYSKDKAQLARRLSRIEGQVRGISRMIERDEYCVDILQQTAALRAAVDALAILVLEDHVQGCVRTAAERGEADAYVQEVLARRLEPVEFVAEGAKGNPYQDLHLLRKP